MKAFWYSVSAFTSYFHHNDMCIVHTVASEKACLGMSSEEIKPVALSSVELCFDKGISYLVRQQETVRGGWSHVITV